ncbi:MAG: TIGR01777 family protein [Bacteroidetes bacterium]|nr:MAG: TIGR01777 family protein [Bacteroidota bacterium]
MAHVLITGGSGAIGSRLIEKLQAEGHTVAIIGRSVHANAGVPSFVWDLEKGTMDERALKGVTHIIHLAGAGIADKSWSPARKKEIVESRVKPLELLSSVLKKRNQRVEAIISSSATGFYGAITSERIFQEADPAAADFLGSTCMLWEDAVQLFKPVAEREVRIRTGIVLMQDAGALPKLSKPAKLGFGAAVGTGKQWMPWIHVEDLVNLYAQAVVDTKLFGPLNAVAPEHASQTTMIQKIGRALNRPTFLPPVPKFMIKTVLGEMASVITEGSRVSSQKLLDTGFEFRFPRLQPALNNLLK